jgi:hypothetical protein
MRALAGVEERTAAAGCLQEAGTLLLLSMAIADPPADMLAPASASAAGGTRGAFLKEHSLVLRDEAVIGSPGEARGKSR